MTISIVTSLFRSEKFVDSFYSRHLQCIQQLGCDYEFIFVNDGSPDSSAEKVRRLIEKDERVGLVDLSRNFGQHAAMYAGLKHASGDLIMALDCDLEEDPENLLPMYELFHQKKTVDVVYGVLMQRSGGVFRNYFGAFFYKIMNLLSDVDIPPNQAWQRLMSRRYVQSLLSYTEGETLPAGLMILTGFEQIPYVIDKKFKGSSSYSFKKRFLLALHSMMAFSSKPLVIICVAGLLITFISGLVGLSFFLSYLLGYEFVSGWLSLFLSIWFLGGVNLFSMGIIGLYISKVFNQVRQRPKFIVRSAEGCVSGGLEGILS